MRTAIILAGGRSTRIKGDKGLRMLQGEPLVRHVIRRMADRVDEVILVLGSEGQRRDYSQFVGGDAKLVVDLYGEGSPLVGAMTGLKSASGEYALITACDMPFTPHRSLETLFEEGAGFDGAVFQWPNGWTEPLPAVYRVRPSLEKASELYEAGDLRIRRVLQRLPDVTMIPIGDLKTIDPELRSLFDADTEKALQEAEKILKKEKGYAVGNASR
jgi:molybdopterin-guanine dinucleotide biosynthesis protein A